MWCLTGPREIKFSLVWFGPVIWDCKQSHSQVSPIRLDSIIVPDHPFGITTRSSSVYRRRNDILEQLTNTRDQRPERGRKREREGDREIEREGDREGDGM
eukprot:sb/3478674/